MGLMAQNLPAANRLGIFAAFQGLKQAIVQSILPATVFCKARHGHPDSYRFDELFDFNGSANRRKFGLDLLGVFLRHLLFDLGRNAFDHLLGIHE
jgi:hypothetical protein